MDCRQSHNLFDAHLDGELEGSLAAELGAHLLKCADCRRELALLEVAGRVIAADTDVPEMSGDFMERLLACAEAQNSQPMSRKRLLLYAGLPLAAAACLALMVGVLSHRSASGDHAKLEPVVAPDVEMDRSPEAVLERVEEALAHDPDNPRLQELADALRMTGKDIVEGAKDTTNLLENLSEETIMGILESIPVDSATDGEASPVPEDDHDPAIENL